MSQADPLGYYAKLGVAPTAPASVIRAAYRALAMEQHPDRDSDTGATKRFQELQQAFDVLSDPEKRAEYDAPLEAVKPIRAQQTERPAARPDRQASTTAMYEPVRCESCLKITACPRYRVFFKVFSYLLGAVRSPIQGIYCAQCEMKVGAKCTGITLVTGWWSLHGFVWTLDSLRQNLFGANTFAEQNARLLGRQVAYFMSTGNQQLALVVAREAYAATLRVRDPNSKTSRMRAKLGYAQDDPLKELRQNLETYIKANDAGGTALKLRNGAGMFSPAFYVQAAMVGALCCVLGLWGLVEYGRSVDADNYRRFEATIAQQNADFAQRQAVVAREEAALARKQQEVTLAANLRPLPLSGEYGSLPWRQYATTNHPPFKVIASKGAHFFIKVTDWNSDATVAMLFVRSGEEGEIGVPPGTYRIKLASGQKWYGEEMRFGPDTSYSKVGKPQSFRIDGEQLMGHELRLEMVVNGNLRRESIKANEF